MSLADLPTYLPLEEAAKKYDIPLESLIQAVEDNIIKAIQVDEVIAVADEDIAIVAAQVEGDELVSINEAARRLDLHSGTVYQWHKQGWLPALAAGSRRAKLISWKRAQALGRLHKRTGQRGSRLIPRGQKVSEILTP